jgi:type II secretory pathway pseudopilin PulG
MIVVVIVGLLLSVAVPNVGRQISTDRANRAAAVILGMLDEAGQLAVRRRAPVTVTLSSGVVFVRDRATNSVLRQRTFGGNDMKATVSFAPNAGITIFPNGRANTALTVTVTGGNATATVSRSATGILRRD